MDYIKQQFLDYKLSTDALWLNNQIGASISQSLRMGTGGATTSGMFGGFSLVSPVGSSGSVMVNPMERSERMHITATGVTQNNPAVFRVIDGPIIDSVSPKSVAMGVPTTVIIEGSGFSDGIDKVEIFFNNKRLVDLDDDDEDDKILINNNQITIEDYSSIESGIVHIYLRKPGGVSSNNAYILIESHSSSIPTPKIDTFVSTRYLLDSDPIASSRIIVIGTGISEDYTKFFVNNNFVDKSDLIFNSGSSPVNIINLQKYLVTEGSIPTITPCVIPITIVNPPGITTPGGGSSSYEFYVLPKKTGFPEIWGISLKQTSVTNLGLNEDLIIYGAGFVPPIHVMWGDELINSYSIINSNEIHIPKEWFNDHLNEEKTVEISVRNGGSSGSIEKSSGSLYPAYQIIASLYPIEHIFIRFVDLGYIPFNVILDSDDNPRSITLHEFFRYYYGVILKDSYNDLSIEIKANPRIISSDWNYLKNANPNSNPNLNYYNITYQTDLVLNVTQNKTHIMGNYVIKSNISQNEEIWFDLMNPAYGICDFIKAPFEFNPQVVSGSNPPLDPKFTGAHRFSVDYVILSNLKNGTIIIDNALGGLEYNSKNYYYRSQQDFIYQNGGVFVEQPDGSYPLVLPPISISRDGDNLVVGITNIPVSGYDTVGGSSQVQVSSTLDSVNTFGLTPGLPNAKSVLLHIDPTTESNWVKWITTLKAICENARSNGVPVAFSRDDDNYDSAWVRIEDDVSGVPMLNIRGGGDENDQDIILDLKTSEFSVSLNPVGKAVSIR
ncbi:IPT/TIG domain-containing protein [Methanospirillum purgamenti]|uniref:IPT/TIG domain-containing protein n=1 Tax=Methanospirillum hungatei TaxID=2203 RepID=A0A8F5ZDM2_METHU|nr:IPT/TIG domain-containing protein [Methanospirillum hungatei]QXO93867.1 IPT/TIG domain-containing protein [Methanospirillum hungatei]